MERPWLIPIGKESLGQKIWSFYVEHRGSFDNGLRKIMVAYEESFFWGDHFLVVF